MTISSQVRTAGPFIGTGLTTIFPFAFKVFQASDLLVARTDTGLTQSTLSLSVDYTVLLNADQNVAPGGLVTLLAALPLNYSLTITSGIALLQPLSLPNQGGFFPRNIEDELDRLTILLQQLGFNFSQTLRVPEIGGVGVVSALTARANNLLGFDSLGNPIAVAPTSGSAAALATDLTSTALAAKGAGQIGFSYALNYAASTLGVVAKNVGIDITQPPFNCDKTGVADCSAAINLALTTYPGIPLHFPKGTYRCDATLSIKPAPVWSIFGPGTAIRGDGVGATFFDNRVANGPMIDIDSDTHGGSYHANMGVILSGFNIITTTSPVASTGVRVLNAYQVEINQVVIKGLTANGIELKNGLYADDGWNRVSIVQCYIDSCAGWGIKADGSAGRNEGSYTYLRNVFFQANGTASVATPPPSGGMIWKGQVLVMESCAFANGTQNVGLFIKGDSGLAQIVDLRNTTFENCVKRGLYCTGVSAFKGRNLQFFNNDTFIATNACEFDGATYTVRQVDLDGVVVRATAGNNAYTAFKVSGANTVDKTVRVRNVTWDNFDFAGQTRFNGVKFDSLDQNCVFEVLNGTSVRFAPRSLNGTGNTTPLRLRGGLGGVASASGEWGQEQIPVAGLPLSNAGLVASTQYYAYLYDAAGSTMLALATVAPQQDATTGYWVNSGTFASAVLVGQALCVGAVQTDSGILFNTAPGAINYSASMTPDASLAAYSNGQLTVTVSNATAFTINAPVNPTTAQTLTFTIRNSTGGAIGAVTWNAIYKMSAWTQPATNQSRSVTFRYGQGVWLQIAQTGADVPN